MLFGYTLRNLLARARFVVPTILALTFTLAAVIVMLAMVGGLQRAIEASGSSDTAIVIGKNAMTETGGKVSTTALGAAKVAPGVKSAPSGAQLISPEFVAALTLRRNQDEVLVPLTLRGVDPIALEVHPGVKLVSGRWPNQAEPGLVVGVRRVGELKGLAMGQSVRVGRKDWPVIGTFEAPGTRFESEVWADRSALLDSKKETESTVLYAILDSPAAFDGFQASVGKLPEVDVLSERQARAQLLSRTSTFVRALQALILILAIGAIFACSNSMHSTFLARIRELATLRAIGYTPFQVVTLLLQETAVLTGVSSLLGLAIAAAVHGRTFAYNELGLIYAAQVTPDIIGVAAGVALVIGLVGALTSIVHSLRLDVLQAIRTGT